VDALRDAHRRTSIESSNFGNVNSFLNRLAALPVVYQNGLFEAFADCVRAEVVEAKMRDKYDEGVPEIKAAKITMDRVEQVTDRMRAAVLTVDRGCEYEEVVARRCELEGGSGDFYLSNHYDKQTKVRLIVFATKVHGRPSFACTRPNMGRLRSEMASFDLASKYTLVEDVDVIQRVWEKAYAGSHHDSRGGRLTSLMILYGEVLPYWRELESVTIQLSGQLTQMYRALRAVRAVAVDATTKSGHGSGGDCGDGEGSSSSSCSPASSPSRTSKSKKITNTITLIGIRTHPVVLGFLRAQIHQRVKAEQAEAMAAAVLAKQEGRPAPPTAGALESLAPISPSSLKKMNKKVTTMKNFFKRKEPSKIDEGEENFMNGVSSSASASSAAASSSSSSSPSSSSSSSWRPTAAARMEMQLSASNKKQRTSSRAGKQYSKVSSKSVGISNFFAKGSATYTTSAASSSSSSSGSSRKSKKVVQQTKSPFFQSTPQVDKFKSSGELPIVVHVIDSSSEDDEEEDVVLDAYDEQDDDDLPILL
jgi:hypothetical protein